MNPPINNRGQQPGGNLRGENRAAPIIYAPTENARSGSNLAGIIGTVAGGIFVIGGLLFTVVLLFVFPPLAAFSCLFSVIGLVMAAGFGWSWVVKRSTKLQLTPYSLLHSSRAGKVELQLDRINRLSAVQKTVWREDTLTRARYQIHYYCIRIEAITNNYIELDVTQSNYTGTFDVGKILRDLLPLLPASVQIDPRIRSYLQTGVIT